MKWRKWRRPIKIWRLFIKLCHWFPKVPFFLKMAIFVNLEVPFLSEIRKTSVRLVVPFSKNTTHPHPHHPPNDEIRLINTSVPKIKSWNCSITFFSSQTFFWDIMEIVITKWSVQNCVGGISGEKGAHPQKILYLRSSEGNLCTITTHPHYTCPWQHQKLSIWSNNHHIFCMYGSESPSFPLSSPQSFWYKSFVMSK